MRNLSTKEIETEKVVKMLKHLINTMRSRLAGVRTQAAKIVSQVLDVVEPLLAIILCFNVPNGPYRIMGVDLQCCNATIDVLI